MPSITVGQSIGSINKTYQRSGDDPINVEVTLPAGKDVTSWVKTDANTAACNLPSGHGYTDGKFDVYWSGGYRYGVDGTISTNALSLDGGAGTDFPSSATTGVVVCKRVVINKAIDGDNLAAIGLSYELASSSGYGSLVLAFDAINAGGLDINDWKESYKIARYAGKFTLDEQDIINDRFGALEQQSPMDMGLSAAQLRPGLVYSEILNNAALDADGGNLFNATAVTTLGGHANYGTTGTALDATPLQAGISAIASQRIKNRPLNLQPRFLIVPQALRWTAEILLKSQQRIISSASGGTYNPLENLLVPIVDDRLGVSGVVDPRTGNVVAGSATNWLLACRPGDQGAKTIMVGYLAGSGRAPKIRSYVLDRGQWGIGWDIAMDIGVKALDFRAMYLATGAS